MLVLILLVHCRGRSAGPELEKAEREKQQGCVGRAVLCDAAEQPHAAAVRAACSGAPYPQQHQQYTPQQPQRPQSYSPPAAQQPYLQQQQQQQPYTPQYQQVSQPHTHQPYLQQQHQYMPPHCPPHMSPSYAVQLSPAKVPPHDAVEPRKGCCCKYVADLVKDFVVGIAIEIAVGIGKPFKFCLGVVTG